jgi:hypothetical protein
MSAKSNHKNQHFSIHSFLHIPACAREACPYLIEGQGSGIVGGRANHCLLLHEFYIHPNFAVQKQSGPIPNQSVQAPN